MRTAVIDEKTGLVVTVVDFSAEGYEPGPGLIARDAGDEATGGWTWDGRKFVAPVTSGAPPADVEERRLETLSQVDRSAETARLQYLTPGMGQSLTYQAKADELRRYDKDPNPVKADYPFLSAEIGVTGASLTAVADAVREALSVWWEKGPQIEHVRLKAKSDIGKADSSVKIDAIVSALVWP